MKIDSHSKVVRKFAFAQASVSLAAAMLAFAGCASAPVPQTARVFVPRLRETVVIDGKLTEPCYNRSPTVTRFLVAGKSAKASPPTRAWLFWGPERLVFAFDVRDRDIVAAPGSDREHDVDSQDRVEIFLWSGRTNDVYYCIEIGARGAVHDYAARFYRRFDDTWSPTGWRFAVAATPEGYQVEGELPRAAMERMGFRLAPGKRVRAGLFRADFHPGVAEPD